MREETVDRSMMMVETNILLDVEEDFILMFELVKAIVLVVQLKSEASSLFAFPQKQQVITNYCARLVTQSPAPQGVLSLRENLGRIFSYYLRNTQSL